MLTRIVKMRFRVEEVPIFLALFEENRSHIASQPGCSGLQLLRGKDDPTLFFTYSHWEGKAQLNAYRNSALFGKVWPATKALFAEKPEAWSVEEI